MPKTWWETKHFYDEEEDKHFVARKTSKNAAFEENGLCLFKPS
jgi:hypothetical protein